MQIPSPHKSTTKPGSPDSLSIRAASAASGVPGLALLPSCARGTPIDKLSGLPSLTPYALRLLVIVVLALGLLFASPAGNVAAFAENGPVEENGPIVEKGPLYEREPYDLITLGAANKNKVLKVEPLDLPNRRLPKNPHRSRKLKVRLWEDPETLYELRWGAIANIDLFEQLILKKAVELIREGESEGAFEYLTYLETNDPTLPGLDAAVQEYLYREASLQQKRRRYRGALAMLGELHRRNSQYPNLAKALGAATEKLVEQYVSKKDYASARMLIDALAKRFPQQATGLKWKGRLKGEAEALLKTSRQAFAAGDFCKADQAGRQIAGIWPGLPGAKELVDKINKRYPRVVVGVNMAADIDRADKQMGERFGGLCSDWATRRSGRLLHRTLSEYFGPGAEGGIYRCGVGKMEISELERRITFQIRPDIRWSQTIAGLEPGVSPQDAGELSGADVARRLVAMADPDDDCYSRPWSGLLGSVSVNGVFRVEIELTRSHVRPDALLQILLPPHVAGRISPQQLNLSNGPYDVLSHDKDEAVYVFNKNYFAGEKGQPKEIVERVFKNNREMARALGDGRIMLIDRVNPWDLNSVRSIQGVVVRPYAVPLVHCLIPNRGRPLMAQRAFRRAIIYGINRQAILDHLLGGEKMSGCGVISGPFLRGESYDDPLGYAHDATIKPRPHEPHLAIALAGVAVDMLAAARAKKAAAKKAGAEQPPDENADRPVEKEETKKSGPNQIIARLVLAHPGNEVSRVACAHIKRQLKLVGIEITLRELALGPVDEGPVEKVPEDVDLLYAELPMWEPIINARELLGESGPSRGTSSYMGLALRQLDLATDWRQVRAKLRQIHRIAHNDVAVIPLWRMTDHFAHRRGLRGLGEQPVLLYQNVEQWRIDPDSTRRHGDTEFSNDE